MFDEFMSPVISFGGYVAFAVLALAWGKPGPKLAAHQWQLLNVVRTDCFSYLFAVSLQPCCLSAHS